MVSNIFKVSNKDTVFIVNFEHILKLSLMFLLLILKRQIFAEEDIFHDSDNKIDKALLTDNERHHGYDRILSMILIIR